VGGNIAVFYRLLNQGHVACGALTPRAALGVMSMLAHCSVESCSVTPGVATEAEGIASEGGSAVKPDNLFGEGGRGTEW